jgi:putative PIN family toxin of toxin-antitoxin system
MPPLPVRHGERIGEEAASVKLVLDTNIVLDLWVFRDPAVTELGAAISGRKVTWLATAAMRDELACVLAYEQIAARMNQAGVSAQQVLASFDAHAQLVDVPPPARVSCRDGDDQKFVDLAVAHEASLLSKDKALLALRRKLPVARGFSALPPR